MKERLRTLVLALAALALLAAMMFGSPQRDDRYRPLATEENVSGLVALERWLGAAGVDVRITEDGFEALPEGAGHVLLAHSPQRRRVRADEREALLDWVRAGNRYVVADFGNEEFPPSRVSSLLQLESEAPGLELEDGLDDDGLFGVGEAPVLPFEELPPWVWQLGALEARVLEPTGAHPLTAGVERLDVVGDLHGHRWRQQDDAPFPWLPLLRDADSFGEVAWIRQFGDGEIILIIHPSMFANGALGRADNAVFAARLLTPDRGSALLLDDHHQTPPALGAGGRLLADPRLHATLLVLVLFWVLWLLADDGAWERRVLARPGPIRERVELVRAVGGFLARHMDEREAADRLLEPVRERLAARHGVPRAEALDALAEEPAVDAARRRAWNEMIESIRRGRRVSLTKVRTMTLDMLERLA